MNIQPAKYGQGDATYQAVGRAEGLRTLVNCFYDQMEVLSEAKKIRAMHPEDLLVSRDKLYCFLSGWMGGPRLFADKYGSIAIPSAHSHLVVDQAEGEAWLCCMEMALHKLNYPDDFRDYLLTQLKVPVDRIKRVSKSK